MIEADGSLIRMTVLALTFARGVHHFECVVDKEPSLTGTLPSFNCEHETLEQCSCRNIALTPLPSPVVFPARLCPQSLVGTDAWSAVAREFGPSQPIFWS